MAELDPWDRQPGETSKAYEAFCIYRDMGAERTVRGVAEHLNKSQQLINGWSGKNEWVVRAAAFDSVPGKAVAEAYAEMARDIAEQHRALSTKLMARLSANLDLLPKGADPSIKWSTAHGAARQGHALATDLVRPESGAKEEMTKAIAALVDRLASGE